MPGKRKRARAASPACRTGEAAGTRAGAQQPKQAKYSRHTSPQLALHLSMLLPQDTQPWPVAGVWPAIRMEEAVRMQLLSAIARKLVPCCDRPEFDDHQAGKCFTAHRGRCLKTKSGPGVFQQDGCGEPDWLRQALWNIKQDDRWQFRLRPPACTLLEDPEEARQQHKALAAAVVARFVGTGKLVEVRRAEMLECLGSGQARHLPWHAVHRLLCYDRHGPPPGTGKSVTGGLLLQGHEGRNLACHSACTHGESCSCVTSSHISWGSQQHNAGHRMHSKRARVDKKLSNFTKGQWE